MEIQETAVDRSQLPPWTGKLSATCKPVFVGIMETDHGDIAQVQEKMSLLGEKHGVPKEVIAQLLKTAPATIFKERKEHHIIMVVEDTATKTAQVIVSHAVTRSGKPEVKAPDLFDSEPLNELDAQIMSAKTTFTVMQYRDDWHGKRKIPAFTTEGTPAKILQEIESAGYGNLFRLAIPTDTAPVRVKREVTVTKEKRAELVKKFGEKAIKQLEKKLKTSTI